MAKQEFLYLNSRDELLRLDINKIVYFEGEGNYTYIVSANNLKGVVCINLARIQVFLNEKLQNLGLFLFLYTTLARTKPNVISYMNAFGLAIFVSFIICFIYIFPFSSKNSNEKTQNKELDKPQSLIIAIYQGRYNTRNDLFRFYTNYTSKKDTFIDLLNVICEVCIESINNQDLSQIIKERCQKVYSVVKPILEEEKEVEYLMNVTGKERDSLMYLHNSSKKLDVSKQEAVIRHLSIIADSIIITKNKLTEENNRNTQSLTLSMIGIILTILFSLLSLLSAENFSALHIYMDYIK